jgi:beta-1,4-mannosyl-glycoprotein beta-1,4-N-acetylglucosaminyltransferase
MKIIDTTTFYKENMMLELRFNMLDQYVDYFVICESKYSHSGNKKRLFFDYKKFKKFKKKIIYLVVENEPDEIVFRKDNHVLNERINSIVRISHQRDFIRNALENFSSNDFVLHSDNDEIPNLSNLNFQKLNEKILIFKQKLFYFKFNLQLPGVDWFGTKGCRVKDLKSITWLRNIKNKRYNFFRFDTFFSKYKFKDLKIIDKGGWHFSNLKNIDDLRDKYLNDENHAEHSKFMNLEKIKADVLNWEISYDHHADKKVDKYKKTKLSKVMNFELPEYLQKNLQKYKDWIV